MEPYERGFKDLRSAAASSVAKCGLGVLVRVRCRKRTAQQRAVFRRDSEFGRRHGADGPRLCVCRNVVDAKVWPTSAYPVPRIFRAGGLGGEIFDVARVPRIVGHRTDNCNLGDTLKELFEAGKVAGNGCPMEGELCIARAVEGKRAKTQQ